MTDSEEEAHPWYTALIVFLHSNPHWASGYPLTMTAHSTSKQRTHQQGYFSHIWSSCVLTSEAVRLLENVEENSLCYCDSVYFIWCLFHIILWHTARHNYNCFTATYNQTTIFPHSYLHNYDVTLSRESLGTRLVDITNASGRFHSSKTYSARKSHWS